MAPAERLVRDCLDSIWQVRGIGEETGRVIAWLLDSQFGVLGSMRRRGGETFIILTV